METFLGTSFFALLFKFVKFGTVGGICFALDMGLTYFFKEKVKLNKFIANSIGFVFSALLNFFLNKYWTFQDTQKDFSKQFLTFAGIAIGGLLLNNFVVWILHEKMGVKFYYSKLCAVFVVVFYNFTMNYLFTFHK